MYIDDVSTSIVHVSKAEQQNIVIVFWLGDCIEQMSFGQFQF